jgi:hypothetical protein
MFGSMPFNVKEAVEDDGNATFTLSQSPTKCFELPHSAQEIDTVT